MNNTANRDEIDDLVSRMRLIQLDQRYLVVVQERKFYVTKFLFDLFLGIQSLGAQNALQEVEAASGPVHADALAGQLLERARSMSAVAKSAAYIAFPMTLLTPAWVERLARPVVGLFRLPLATGLLGMAVLVNAWCLVHFGWGNAATRFLNLSPGGLLAAYAALLAGLLVHELGHATAALAGGLPARRIGIGFYLLLPVLFADVSHVWELSRMRRIAVSLGGIYFQLLFNALLIGVVFAGPVGVRAVALDLVRINIGIVVYVLIPFLRNDGYWVLADLWDKPRLDQDGRSAPYRLLRSLAGYRERPRPGFALVLYGALGLAFFALTSWLFVSWSGLLLGKVWHVARADGLAVLAHDHAGLLLATFFPLSAILVLGTTVCKHLLKANFPRSPA